jgi:LuxR family transcriptional regulator, maltose regulon positive regulatory protein
MDRPPPARGAPSDRLGAARRLVRRDPLLERLSAAVPGGVAMVCAPAGSGKTALLASWAEAVGWERVAWVGVERGERDAQRFWLSVVEALSGAVGGARLVERVSPSPAFRGDVVVERLLSELRSLDEPVVLAIDDLHELCSAEAEEWLERFIARRPPGLTVVLATREEPRLGLHRLRLAGEVSELRGSDLRFSLDEARALLETAGIHLSAGGLALLHERTEGWAAGLRLAAISLADHPDPERFVREFSGSERTVAAYLLAEVLEHQRPEVRGLLLRTSVLERVSGPVADVLTGGSGSERMLQELEESNAFVTSLDAGRTWFRYHHLFADLLRLELRRVSPEVVGSLHRAAAAWHEEQGFAVEAIRHAQAAKDWPHATRLVADNELRLVLDGRRATLAALLAAFPPEATADPELALAHATGRALDGLLDDAAAYIAAAERSADMVPGDRRWLLGLRLAAIRLFAARQGGDVTTAVEQARVVQAALAAAEPHVGHERSLNSDDRAVAFLNLGIAELWSLRPGDARRDLEQALELAQHGGRAYVEIDCLAHLALAIALSGLPATGALPLAERAVALAEAHGWTTDPIAAAAFAVGGNLLVRQGRLEDGERWLDRAERALGRGEPGTGLVLHSARGLVRLAQGRPGEALAAFRRAERTQAALPNEHALNVELRSRLLQTQVRLGETAAVRSALAGTAAEERDRAGMRIAAAVADLAEDDPEAAIGALAPVIERTVSALHPGWAAVEASLLDAAARDRLGNRSGSEASIERALELAEPDGLLLPFVLTPVGALLERHPRHRSAHATLLATVLDLLAGSAPPAPGDAAPLPDPLSGAELRVLRYLPSNLKTPEIAAELFVSANTVRTHVRHIYAKLNAHDRSEAVARARELRLLGPATRPR